jgi:hypothetical protein
MHFSLKDILKFSAWVVVILFLLAIIITFFSSPRGGPITRRVRPSGQVSTVST